MGKLEGLTKPQLKQLNLSMNNVDDYWPFPMKEASEDTFKRT